MSNNSQNWNFYNWSCHNPCLQKTDSAIYIHDDHLYLERVAALTTTISFKENGYQSCHVTKIKRVIHGWKWFVKTLNTDIKRLVVFFHTALNLFGSLSKQSILLGTWQSITTNLFFWQKTTGGLNCYISHLFITMKNYYYFLNLFSLKAYLNVHHSQFILCHWKNSITTLTNVFI